MRRSYLTARMVIAALEITGWAMILLAVAGFFLRVYDYSRDPMSFAIPLGILVTGIAQIAGAQITRAIVATAENSERTVELLENICRQLPQQAGGSGRIEPNITAPPVPRDG